MTKRKHVPVVTYRRKREQKTNYKKRLYVLKGRTPRLVVRKSLQGILLQLVEYNPVGDKILLQIRSSELTKYGMKTVNGNIPCAYLTGLLLGVKAKKAGIKKAVADLGLQKASPRLFAALKGAADGGLDIPIGESAVPVQERLEGRHIAKNKATTFTRYDSVEKYPELVEQVKQTILQS